MEERSEGIWLGMVIAVVISWTVNNSVLWCIIHGILGWVYVLYYVFLVLPASH